MFSDNDLQIRKNGKSAQSPCRAGLRFISGKVKGNCEKLFILALHRICPRKANLIRLLPLTRLRRMTEEAPCQR